MCEILAAGGVVTGLFSAVPKSLIVFLVACVVLSSLLKAFAPKIKGWFGEWMVRRVLAKLPPGEYQQWHDVYLLDSEGHTTQIDHLVASKYGIFVIETKNYKGWIFGTEKQGAWTQNIYGKKFKFQNPLYQNSRHIRVLAESTGLKPSDFHNVVYFIGDSTLKTELPANVMTNGLRKFIEDEKTEIFNPGLLSSFSRDIDRLDLSRQKGIGRRHVRSLRERKAA